MRLLFDENLSPRLVSLLSDIYPNCESVLHVELAGVSDDQLWVYAQTHNMAIVSKDIDFAEKAILASSVKVVWIRLGNCTTEASHLVLRNSAERLAAFVLSGDYILELP